jgi:hypothetical protein
MSNVSSSGYGAEESSAASISSGRMSSGTSIEYKLTKTLDPAALKRASLALQEAIKELEDETEDEIVLPRSRTPYGVINDASDPVSGCSCSYTRLSLCCLFFIRFVLMRERNTDDVVPAFEPWFHFLSLSSPNSLQI